MIRLAGAQETFLGISPENLGVFVVKQISQYKTYGIASGVFELWVQTEDEERVLALISRFSGTLTVTSRPPTEASLEELREFLLQLGGNRLEGEEGLLRRIGIAGDALLSYTSAWIMRAGSEDGEYICREAMGDMQVRQTLTLAPVYHLLCRADLHFQATVPYAAWLTDFSHRCRHDLAQCYILMEENNIISTASILFQGHNRGIVGGVATDPDCRGKGCARRVLERLRGEAAAERKELWLFAATDALADFYESCGWKRDGRWASRQLAPL